MLSMKDAQAIAIANGKRLREELATKGPISLGPPSTERTHMTILTETQDRKVVDKGDGRYDINVTLDGTNWLTVTLDTNQQNVIGSRAHQTAVIACLANIKFYEVPEFMERRGQSRYKYLTFYVMNLQDGRTNNG